VAGCPARALLAGPGCAREPRREPHVDLQAICADQRLKQAALEWVQALTPVDVVDFEFVDVGRGKVSLTLVESGGHKTSAYSASDGTLRFLGMLAALMGPKRSKMYFFEEIENAIHPTRLHLLVICLSSKPIAAMCRS